MEQTSDSRLVELAQRGDQDAFAELYSRYFDPVYDFIARMTRDRDEAADIAQDTFLKAMYALGGLHKGASFKGWIFTIARNTALNRMERAARTRPLAFEDSDGEEVLFDVVDSDRFGDPAEAAQANAMAALVWEAAAGLDPRQLSLLDLHLRQGLDSAEIAAVMGVTKNNGYVLVNRLKKAVEDAIGAFIMFKDGRRYCDRLDAALASVTVGGMSPETRRLVERHVAQCELCEGRKTKLVAPLAVFGAFAAVGPPVGAKAHALEQILEQWPGPAASVSAGGASGGALPARIAQGRHVGRIFAMLGLAAGMLLLALLVPASPIALTRFDGSGTAVQAGPDGGTPGSPPDVGSPTRTPTAFGGGAPSPTPRGTTPSSGASPTTQPIGIVPTSTAVPNTATPLPGATPTPPPAATPTKPAATTSTPAATATATPTPPPPPTPTPPPCTPSLSATPGLINASAGHSTFELLNSGCRAVEASITVVGAAWLTVEPSTAALQPFGQKTISATATLSGLSEGLHTAAVRVAWPDGSFDVAVQVNRPGFAPTISRVSAQCSTTAPSLSFSALVADDYAVKEVRLQFVRPDGASGSVAMTLDGELYRAKVTGPLASYSIIATDFANHVTTSSGTCPT